MKKILKINIIFILMFTTILILTNISFASIPTDGIEIGTSLRGEASDIGNSVTGAIKVVGIICSVIIIMIVGIKYMLGSVEEKAEYKQTAIIYIIGAILLFGTSFIIDTIYNMFN